MARHYSASSFFRQIPNDLLARCCESQGLGSELDFAVQGDVKTAPIYS